MNEANVDLIKAMQVLEEEKGISPEVVKEALESALVLAYKKNYDQAQNVEVNFDMETGAIKVYSVKEVVETNFDRTLEISIEEAMEINPHYEIGDYIKFEVTPDDFGRIATQTAKHVILQRLREAERESVYEEYVQYEDEIMTGTVDRQDQRFVYIDFGRIEAVMPQREQIPGEQYEMDDRIKVYVSKVDKTNRGPQMVVSRSQPEFLKRLFEQEVPEIYEGIVEIMSIAREAGDRSKIAVRSRDNQIDPVGTCVGQGGSRVNAIVRELNGENMDIVEYNEDPAIFIENAMSPSQVVDVVFEDTEENSVIVVVPDYQLSLAIGKKGQNARLAARLTGYRIDIKSETDYAEYLAEKETEEVEEALDQADDSTDLTIDEIESEETILTDDIPVEADETFEEVTYGTVDTDSVESSEDLMRVNDEENTSPEEMEEVIGDLEIDREQDYDELVEETTYDEYVEETSIDDPVEQDTESLLDENDEIVEEQLESE
ncbi:transcription termination/antitermination protein NusA [Aerococcaceae bacterium DSM 111020]|nr:transcription termination/antitermination protein NusA [Aerococcaceae bacterium DSM 111020]